MPAFSGSFSGNIRTESILAPSDQPHHSLNIAEISGVQKSTDEKWNNSAITYWGTMDVIENRGTQQGYFVNDHGAAGRDFGTFEGSVSASGGQITVEGTWKYTGGTGNFKYITGGGTFKTRLTSPTQVEGTWQGAYELAAARAAG